MPGRGARWARAAAVCGLALVCACAGSVEGSVDEKKMERTGEGAAKGAAVGAVAGLVGEAIFGGSMGTWAGAGAIAGAVIGGAVGASSNDPESIERVEEQGVSRDYLRETRKRLGPAAYAGLEALAACRHEEALQWAETAAYSENPDHQLAGQWLAAMTYLDAGDREQAARVAAELAAREERLGSSRRVLRDVDDAVLEMRDIRVSFDLPAECPTPRGDGR